MATGGGGGEGGGGGGSGHGGESSSIWNEVRLEILAEAKENSKIVPSYYRRSLGALNNKDHPSIFKRQVRPANHTTAAAVGDTPPELEEAPRGLSAGRDIVVAAVGPYHEGPAAGAPAPLITYGKKCGIVAYLGLDIGDFLDWAQKKENEDRVRRCYERDSLAGMDSQKLAKMLLLDGCLLLFAVFLLRSSVSEDKGPAELADKKHPNHKEFKYLSADISLHTRQTRLDLLMLHNQIPFFVLAELHRRLKRKNLLFHKIDHSIEQLALSCFDDIHPIGFKLWETPTRGGGGDTGSGGGEEAVHHLLHLFHLSRVPAGKYKVGVESILPREPESHLPSATELQESLTAVFERAAPAGGGCGCGGGSLQVTFRRTWLGTRGVMSIPALCVHDYSDRVFRGLLAFEQSHLRCGLGATAYSICMARLLQSEADVRVLRKRGILVHTQKSDREIVDFFKGLRAEYADTLVPDDLLALCAEVTAHRRSPARVVVKCILRRCFACQTVNFFVFFAFLISVATLLNVVYSIIRFYHPYKGISPAHGP